MVMFRNDSGIDRSVLDSWQAEGLSAVPEIIKKMEDSPGSHTLTKFQEELSVRLQQFIKSKNNFERFDHPFYLLIKLLHLKKRSALLAGIKEHSDESELRDPKSCYGRVLAEVESEGKLLQASLDLYKDREMYDGFYMNFKRWREYIGNKRLSREKRIEEIKPIIALLELLLSESLNPENSFHFPEEAHHMFCYVLGSLHEEVGNREAARRVYSLIPYDADLPAEALFNIGCFFSASECVEVTPSVAPVTTTSVDEKQAIKVDVTEQAQKQTHAAQVLAKEQQAAAKAALPYLISAAENVHPDDDALNEDIQIKLKAALFILEGQTPSPVLEEKQSASAAKKTQVVSNESVKLTPEILKLKHKYWIEAHVKPQHDRVISWLAQQEQAVKAEEKQYPEKTAYALKLLQTARTDADAAFKRYESSTNNSPTTESVKYRQAITAVVKPWQDHVAQDSVATGTYVKRVVLNFFILITGTLLYRNNRSIREEVDKSNVSNQGFNGYFFSYKTDRRVLTEKMSQELQHQAPQKKIVQPTLTPPPDLSSPTKKLRAGA